MKKWQIIPLAGFLVGSIALMSQPARPEYTGWNFDQRQERQQDRIDRGVATGALTPREAGKLEREQWRIQAAENRMRADGRFDPRERARLDRMLDKSSRNIYRQSHDRQTAFSRNGHQNNHRFQDQRRHQQGRQWQGPRFGNQHQREVRHWGGNQGRMQHSSYRTANWGGRDHFRGRR